MGTYQNESLSGKLIAEIDNLDLLERWGACSE